MSWRLSRSGWVGLALVLVGIALPLGWQRWWDTRTWVALDMPISLARGHIKSNEFEINLQGGYRIYIEVERKFDYEGVPCLLGLGFPECRNSPGIVKATWSVLDGAQEIARGYSEGKGGHYGDVTMGRDLGWFFAGESRHYVLNLNVLEDGSRLDAGHPRLIVQAEYWPYWKYESYWTNIVLLALVLGSAGAAVLIASIVSQTRQQQERGRVRLTSIGPQPRELFFQKEQANEAADLEEARPNRSLQVWLGAFLLIGGLAAFIAIEGWLATRIWRPVDIPISLGRRRVRTGPFKLNVKAGYGVRIDYDSPAERVDCFWYGRGKARWSLYRNGMHVEDFSDPSPYASLGGFDGNDGTYDLELQIDSDTGCLDAGHPRLRISTERYDFEEKLNPWLWLSALGITCGASLVVLGCWTRFKKKNDTGSALTGEVSVGQNFRWAQQLHLKQSFSGLPSFGLIGALVLVVVWLPMRLFDAIAFDAFRARGLYVQAKRGVLNNNETLRIAITLRIVARERGRAPKIYVNATSVEFADLAKAVQRYIGRGSDATAYVTSEDDVSWADVVNVVDIVHSLGCKVVFLTGDRTGESTQ